MECRQGFSQRRVEKGLSVVAGVTVRKGEHKMKPGEDFRFAAWHSYCSQIIFLTVSGHGVHMLALLLLLFIVALGRKLNSD